MKVYTLKELLSKLKAEHNSSYYYRGQLQDFVGPLWPSMYRGVVFSDTMDLPDFLSRRCNRGKYFAFRSTLLNSKIYSDPENIKLRELKRLLMFYVRNALGYCLSEALFQQAGWSSEGLDVTSNIDIAIFFATHIYKYKEAKYEKDQNLDRQRILYRWKFNNETWDFTKLNKSNYYNCPAIFPSKDILALFDVCESIEEFERSIEAYRDAIEWRGFFDLDSIQDNRPYDIIKIPYQWKMNSRIVQQDASLLFPDSISLEEFHKRLRFSNPDLERIAIKGGLFVEDLSMTCNCEKFIFRIGPDDFETINVSDKQIYIDDDISHRFLSGWMKSFHQSGFGVPKIMVDNGEDNYLIKLDVNMNFNKLRYADNEVLFNG